MSDATSMGIEVVSHHASKQDLLSPFSDKNSARSERSGDVRPGCLRLVFSRSRRMCACFLPANMYTAGTRTTSSFDPSCQTAGTATRPDFVERPITAPGAVVQHTSHVRPQRGAGRRQAEAGDDPHEVLRRIARNAIAAAEAARLVRTRLAKKKPQAALRLKHTRRAGTRARLVNRTYLLDTFNRVFRRRIGVPPGVPPGVGRSSSENNRMLLIGDAR
jgi:hypothetical protein